MWPENPYLREPKPKPMPNYNEVLNAYLEENPGIWEHTPEIAIHLKSEASRLELRLWTEENQLENTEL
jgi:hypothetical protein